MKLYWVEGLFMMPGGRKKSQPSGGAEPFYRSFWAGSPEEALRMASESLQGGKWVEGPIICKTSEEERMRSIGAPELPLFDTSKEPKKRKK